MLHHGPKLKFAAALVAIVFGLHEIAAPTFAWARVTSTPQLIEPGALASRFQLQLSSELGKVESIHSGPGPTIVHLQTAHGNHDAERNIEALLHELRNNHDIRSVFVEGSAAPLDRNLVDFFPDDRKLTVAVIDRLMKKALAKGIDLYLVNSEDAQVYGIEDRTLYEDNIASFRSVLAEQQKTKTFVSEMDLQIKRLAAPYLNRTLRVYLESLENYARGETQLLTWLRTLKESALRHLELNLENSVHQVEWPMLVRMYKLEQFEREIDFEALEGEKMRFLELLQSLRGKVPVDEITRLLDSPIGAGEVSDPETGLLFERLAAALPVDFNHEAYRSLDRFIGCLIFRSEVKADRLMAEAERLNDAILEELAKTDEEKALITIFKDYHLLIQLFDLAITPEEHEVIQKKAQAEEGALNPSSIAKRFLEVNRESRVRDIEFKHLEAIETLFRKALLFYEGAQARDGAMLTNLTREMEEKGIRKAAVITGGFHAMPFQDYFEAEGFNYALVSPKISSVSENNAYVRVMLEDEAFFKKETIERPHLADPTVNFRWALPGIRGAIDAELAGRPNIQSIRLNPAFFDRHAAGARAELRAPKDVKRTAAFETLERLDMLAVENPFAELAEPLGTFEEAVEVGAPDVQEAVADGVLSQIQIEDVAGIVTPAPAFHGMEIVSYSNTHVETTAGRFDINSNTTIEVTRDGRTEAALFFGTNFLEGLEATRQGETVIFENTNIEVRIDGDSVLTFRLRKPTPTGDVLITHPSYSNSHREEGVGGFIGVDAGERGVYYSPIYLAEEVAGIPRQFNPHTRSFEYTFGGAARPHEVTENTARFTLAAGQEFVFGLTYPQEKTPASERYSENVVITVGPDLITQRGSYDFSADIAYVAAQGGDIAFINWNTYGNPSHEEPFQAANPEAVRAFIEQAHAEGVQVVPYMYAYRKTAGDAFQVQDVAAFVANVQYFLDLGFDGVYIDGTPQHDYIAGRELVLGVREVLGSDGLLILHGSENPYGTAVNVLGPALNSQASVSWIEEGNSEQAGALIELNLASNTVTDVLPEVRFTDGTQLTQAQQFETVVGLGGRMRINPFRDRATGTHESFQRDAYDAAVANAVEASPVAVPPADSLPEPSTEQSPIPPAPAVDIEQPAESNFIFSFILSQGGQTISLLDHRTSARTLIFDTTQHGGGVADGIDVDPRGRYAFFTQNLFPERGGFSTPRILIFDITNGTLVNPVHVLTGEEVDLLGDGAVEGISTGNFQFQERIASDRLTDPRQPVLNDVFFDLRGEQILFAGYGINFDGYDRTHIRFEATAELARNRFDAATGRDDAPLPAPAPEPTDPVALEVLAQLNEAKETRTAEIDLGPIVINDGTHVLIAGEHGNSDATTVWPAVYSLETGAFIGAGSDTVVNRPPYIVRDPINEAESFVLVPSEREDDPIAGTLVVTYADGSTVDVALNRNGETGIRGDDRDYYESLVQIDIVEDTPVDETPVSIEAELRDLFRVGPRRPATVEEEGAAADRAFSELFEEDENLDEIFGRVSRPELRNIARALSAPGLLRVTKYNTDRVLPGRLESVLSRAELRSTAQLVTGETLGLPQADRERIRNAFRGVGIDIDAADAVILDDRIATRGLLGALSVLFQDQAVAVIATTPEAREELEAYQAETILSGRAANYHVVSNVAEADDVIHEVLDTRRASGDKKTTLSIKSMIHTTTSLQLYWKLREQYPDEPPTWMSDQDITTFVSRAGRYVMTLVDQYLAQRQLRKSA